MFQCHAHPFLNETFHSHIKICAFDSAIIY